MKLRHAAALALVGWYLMLPPQHGGSADFNTHAPLSEWTVLEKYDDTSACERGKMDQLSKWYDRASVDRPGTKEAEKDILMTIRLNDSQCIASDDPRLKGN